MGEPALELYQDTTNIYVGGIRSGGRLRLNDAPYFLRHMNMGNELQFTVDQPLVRHERDPVLAGATIVNDETLFQMMDRSGASLPLRTIVRYLKYQPVGTRTNVNLTGHTIGQIVHACTEAGVDLRGYFLSGRVRKFIPRPDPEGDNHNVNRFAWNQEEFNIAEFPLSRVDMPALFAELPVNAYATFDLEEYMNAVRYADQGSSLAYVVLWDLCHIKRRTGHGAQYIQDMTYSVETGGFAQLLTEEYLEPFHYLDCPEFDPHHYGKVVRNGRHGVVYTDLNGKVFIPNGTENCVQQCVRHLYVYRPDRASDWYADSYDSGNSGYIDEDPTTGVAMTMTVEQLEHRDAAKIDALFQSFQDKFVAEKLKTKKFTRMKCSSLDKRDKAIKTYKKHIKGGYSNTFLRKLIKHFREESDIVLHILYLFHDGSRTQPYSVRDRGDSFYPSDNSDFNKTHLLLVQMRISGGIFSNYDGVQVRDPTDGDGEKTYLGYLHMVGIYVNGDENDMDSKLLPLLIRKKARQIFFPGVQFLQYISTTVLQPCMDRVRGRLEYDQFISMDKIKRYVDYQLRREAEGKVPTLIFNNQSTKGKTSDDPNLPNRVRLQRMNANLQAGEYAVVAYDLETVELTIDTIESIRPEFRQTTATVEEMIAGGYQPVESVVPFSAQWAPVNVSYRGRMIQRARDTGTRIPVYKCCDATLEGKLIENTTIRVSDVLLQEVETCYGGNVLGECIEEMLTRMARWALNHGYGCVAAYAHNGCGFDAYVCMRYCTFEILRLLKTSRGILILDYKVPTGVIDPITHKEIFIPVRLRDTKVWLNGNLKRIAESFKCPKVWQKIDFPITMINHRNCYNPEIRKVLEVYGENDIRALAWIVRELNYVIGESPWDPASMFSIKPPIVQFVTVMGMVKAATLNHFKRELPRSYIQTLPAAIDIPVLRSWLKKATIGGRVEAYARSYISPLFGDILKAYLAEDVLSLKALHSKMVDAGSCDMVLDVTSLYPTAQGLCPMPTGKLYALSSTQECMRVIDDIGCSDCEQFCKLCVKHRNDTRNVCDGSGPLRPFAIILVKNLIPDKTKMPLYPFCARKLEKDKGLVYSSETNEEIRKRFDDPDIILDVQAYTNVDLYWMKKAGYTFDIVGGYGWETSDTYMSFLLEAFELRKVAKEQGNAVMSEFIKLQINGSYGVTAQGDIDDSGMLLTLPEHLRTIHPKSAEVQHYLHTECRRQLEHSEYVKDGLLLPNGQTFFTKAKAGGLAEYFSPLSPMQIGAAVLAWARHIVNLIIFHPAVLPMKYTDTDSIEITQRAVRFLETQCPGVIDHSKTAPLGTLKNDHLEVCGPGARVFFGIFGTKKVKMYMVLTEDGRVHICTTFKGLNPRMIDDNGVRFHGDHYEHCIAATLVELFYEGSSAEKDVTSWKRSMDDGVSINHHTQHFSSETYLDRSRGSKFELRAGNGLTEMFVPFGTYEVCHNPFYNATAHVTDKKGKKNMKIARNESRHRRLKEMMGGFGHEELNDFLDFYYKQKSDFHLMENEEFRKICQIIQDNTPAS